MHIIKGFHIDAVVCLDDFNGVIDKITDKSIDIETRLKIIRYLFKDQKVDIDHSRKMAELTSRFHRDHLRGHIKNLLLWAYILILILMSLVIYSFVNLWGRNAF